MNLDYIAGLVDADGHFTWRGHPNQTPDVGVTNTSPVLMGALTEALGGSVSRERRACVPGCAQTGPEHIHRRHDILRWHITGYRAVLLCEALVPRLVIKADRAAAMAARYHEHLAAMERPARREHHMRIEREWWTSRGWD